MLREGIPFRTPAREPRHCRGLGDGAFRGQLIFGGVGFQLFELQRQLIDELRRSLRARTVELALQLGDPQFLMRDHGQVFRRLGPCHSQLCGAGIAFRDHLSHLRAFNCERGLQRINIVRQIRNVIAHHRRESHSARVRQLFILYAKSIFSVHPAASGRQVCCGCLQSIPSSEGLQECPLW